jgi:mannitol-1-phosphate/altronate dehydrogenase
MLFVDRIVPRVVAMVAKYGNYDQRKVTAETIKIWVSLNKN